MRQRRLEFIVRMIAADSSSSSGQGSRLQDCASD